MFTTHQAKDFQGWHRQDERYDAFRDISGDHSAHLADIRDFAAANDSGLARDQCNLLVPLGGLRCAAKRRLFLGPAFQPFRHSPEFQAYMTAGGLEDYWRENGFPVLCRELTGASCGFECD